MKPWWLSKFILLCLALDNIQCQLDPVPRVVRAILRAANYNRNELP